MLSLLIVDDELSIVNGLKSIVSKGNTSFENIYCAVNGDEALSIAEEHSISLVITDINMPEMDGLVLIENMKKRELCSRFIILTGYDDFQYAKHAIKLSVSDYLLKPIQSEELLSLLDDNAQVLRKEKNRKTEWAALRIKNAVLYDAEKIDTIFSNKERRELFPYDYFQIVLMKITGDHALSALPEDADICLAKLVSQVNPTVFVLSQHRSNMHIYLLNTPQALSTEDMEKMIDWTSQHYKGTTLYPGVSSSNDNLCNLHDLYMEALKATFLNSVYLKTRYTPFLSSDKQFSDEYYEQMTNRFDQANLNEVLRQFREDMERMLELRPTDIHLAKKMYAYFEIYMHVYLEKMGLTFREVIGENDETSQECHTVDEIKLKLLVKVEKIHRFFWEESGKSLHTNRFKKIEEFILDNYQIDVSLDMAAEHLNLHPNYISTLFKKGTGVTFLQYLQKYRIDKAKQWIRKDPQLSFREIGQKVGLINENYFYKVFKKVTGITPGIFRENLLKQEQNLNKR
jgi:two-component system response regulator YesN